MTAKGARKGSAPAQSNKPERKAPVGKPFRKGQSGNPGGQPKWVRDLRPLLEKDAFAARKLLRTVIRDIGEDMKNRIKAAEVVLKYAVPPPKAEIDVTTGGRPLENVPTERLVEFLRRKD